MTEPMKHWYYIVFTYCIASNIFYTDAFGYFTDTYFWSTQVNFLKKYLILEWLGNLDMQFKITWTLTFEWFFNFSGSRPISTKKYFLSKVHFNIRFCSLPKTIYMHDFSIFRSLNISFKKIAAYFSSFAIMA